ncbi:MAG: PP2C family protein-serine/threonine phosphatase [Pyrinomonadaceae bacterium]
MATAIEPLMYDQLMQRRDKLESATTTFPGSAEVMGLLAEVDAALQRLDRGVFGICEVCHDPVETERLIADPLTRFCLDHLSRNEQRQLEEDLALASQIQTALLPPREADVNGWEIAYHYQPKGAVSGDYCDYIDADDHSLHFVLGDVSGKGVAASMLMAHLQATIRTLVSIKVPLQQMVERVSRVFCESTLPTQYATLVCGRANGNGEVEVCNAGHMPPLLVSANGVEMIEATGLPVGMFCSETFKVAQVQMNRGDTLFLYTDGFTETTDAAGREFGVERITHLLRENKNLAPRELLALCREKLRAFSGQAPADDLTLMAIRRNY